MEGLPFQDVNWLTQVLYYGGFGLGGLELVQTLNALLLGRLPMQSYK